MKIGFQVILYLVIFNLVCSLAYVMGIAGTQYGYSLYGSGDIDDTIERLDPQKFINQTKPSQWVVIEFLGNIANQIFALWNIVEYAIFGFPKFLENIGAAIPNAEARAIFTVLSKVLEATQGLVIILWLVQVITGREMEN